MVPLFLFAALALGAAVLFNVSSCARKTTMEPVTRHPAYAGVPEIRVVLTPSPCPSAALSTTGGYELTLDGRRVMGSASPLAGAVVTCPQGRWRVLNQDLLGQRLVLRMTGAGFARLDGQVFRGKLTLIPAGDNSNLYVINTLDLESYLAGVLAKELMPNWSGEAFGALAIAARTFALYQMQNFGVSHDWDLGTGQAWQVYGGYAAESPRVWQAVRATHGVVLGCGPAGREQIFLAQYSACCGGRVNDASVIRDAEDLPPLRGGQVDEDCQECSRYRWPPVQIPTRDVARAVSEAYPHATALSDVKSIRVAAQTRYGRAVWLDVTGPGGSVRLRAEDLRLALLRGGSPQAKQLYSMNCRLRLEGDVVEFYDGRGFGHGVGLCQWGAEGKARKGWTAQQILAFYYPGAQLFSAY